MARSRVDIIKDHYYEGCKIKICDISDGSYPRAVGQTGTVLCVDDAGQIHCRMDDGSSATVCADYGDRFFRVGE